MARRRGRSGPPHQSRTIQAALCATCLVDQFFPQVGEASVKVLRRLGVDVTFPEDQTCCGQVAFNAGYRQEARELARRMLDIFNSAPYVVVPSGSCAAMIKVHYAALFADEPETLERVHALAQKTYELTSFIVNVLGRRSVGATWEGSVTYHDACHLLRELHIADEPRALLRSVPGLELTEMEESGSCCGFGGLFALKHPHISTAILEDKLQAIRDTGAEAVVANDCGCLMHIAGAMQRRNIAVQPIHIAELLASDRHAK